LTRPINTLCPLTASEGLYQRIIGIGILKNLLEMSKADLDFSFQFTVTFQGSRKDRKSFGWLLINLLKELQDLLLAYGGGVGCLFTASLEA